MVLMSRWRPAQAALLITTLALAGAAGCTPADTGTGIKGVPTKVDTTAKTFSLKGTDGKDYEFKMVPASQGDINEIKLHFDTQKTLAVVYKAGTPPYEVISAH